MVGWVTSLVVGCLGVVLLGVLVCRLFLGVGGGLLDLLLYGFGWLVGLVVGLCVVG